MPRGPRGLDAPCRGATRNGERAPSPVRTTPIALLSRRNLGVWTALADAGDRPAPTPPGGRSGANSSRPHGASFFDEIVDGTRLLRTQVEEALGELVALGLVNADSFAGLRALLVPSDRRRSLGGQKRRRRTALFGIEDAGRWALLRRKAASSAAPLAQRDDPEAVEHVARALLQALRRRLLASDRA